MLVRLQPPELLSSWSSLECSPPCHGGGRGFKSRRGRLLARYANRQSRQAQTLVIVCGFDSHPCYFDACVGWALASLSGRNLPAKAVQVRLLPDALEEVMPPGQRRTASRPRKRRLPACVPHMG